jgi:hypothetical protein
MCLCVCNSYVWSLYLQALRTRFVIGRSGILFADVAPVWMEIWKWTLLFYFFTLFALHPPPPSPYPLPLTSSVPAIWTAFRASCNEYIELREMANARTETLAPGGEKE